MKTAGRENPNRHIAFRVFGAEAENTSCSIGGLGVEKKAGHRRSVFFLTPFIELHGSLALPCYKERHRGACGQSMTIRPDHSDAVKRFGLTSSSSMTTPQSERSFANCSYQMVL